MICGILAGRSAARRKHRARHLHLGHPIIGGAGVVRMERHSSAPTVRGEGRAAQQGSLRLLRMLVSTTRSYRKQSATPGAVSRPSFLMHTPRFAKPGQKKCVTSGWDLWRDAQRTSRDFLRSVGKESLRRGRLLQAVSRPIGIRSCCPCLGWQEDECGGSSRRLGQAAVTRRAFGTTVCPADRLRAKARDRGTLCARKGT